MMSKDITFASVISWSTFVRGEIPADFKDLSEIPGVKIDLRYATADNFIGKNLYGDFKRAFLHVQGFEKLKKAQEYLQKDFPHFHLLVLDALRPRRVQRILFSHVQGTPHESYVANPDKGSAHNFGFAIDLTLSDGNGIELDMGTFFDDFSELAQPQHEDKFLGNGILSLAQWNHRQILYKAMKAGGFTGIPNEWWHFNALPLSEVRRNYPIVD